MSTYKFYYFDIPARGETARILFHFGNQEYEHIQIKKETWQEVKPTTQWGLLPYMEVDGVTLSQSHAINRLLADRFGYSGKTDIERAQVDMIAGCMDDITEVMRQILREFDPEKRAKIHEKVQNESLPFYLKKLEAILVSNKGGDGYFVGDEITLADIIYFVRLEIIRRAKVTVDWTSIPKLAALKERIAAHPKMVSYLAANNLDAEFVANLDYRDHAKK